jgi:hypothetical protein
MRVYYLRRKHVVERHCDLARRTWYFDKEIISHIEAMLPFLDLVYYDAYCESQVLSHVRGLVRAYECTPEAIIAL